MSGAPGAPKWGTRAQSSEGLVCIVTSGSEVRNVPLGVHLVRPVESKGKTFRGTVCGGFAPLLR
jgi:hypothetical protein